MLIIYVPYVLSHFKRIFLLTALGAKYVNFITKRTIAADIGFYSA